MNRHPKLLFLAYTFPPLQTIACVRTWNIAKYLSRLGWDVTVVTPKPSLHSIAGNGAKIKEDLCQAGIRRIKTDHKWRILLRNYLEGYLGSFATRVSRRVARYLDIEPSVGWLKAAEAACRGLTADDVDVVVATGPPFGAFRLAERLAYRLGRPYVLDYRDAWTGSPFAMRPPRSVTVRKERKLLRGSAAVTVVSPSSAWALNSRFDLKSRLHVVTNGYDPEDLANVKPYEFGHFAVVYTGNFLPPKRVITPVMAALQRLGQLNRDAFPWKFHYYGSNENHVREEAERHAVIDHVVLHGRVSHAEALSAVKGASIAVVVHSTADFGTQEELGVIPGKTFEPLGLGTPILLIAPRGSDVCDVVKNGGVAQHFAGSDIEGAANYLLRQLRTARGAEVGCPNGRYSWPVLASQLDEILKNVIGTPAAVDPDSSPNVRSWGLEATSETHAEA